MKSKLILISIITIVLMATSTNIAISPVKWFSPYSYTLEEYWHEYEPIYDEYYHYRRFG